MKKYLPIVLVLALCKFIVHAIANSNYGFHRDELLHLSVSEHLAWGFYEFPPFIAFIGKLSGLFFDYSLWGTRLFPTLAGIAILVLCCLIAKELGGKSKAILLAGICVLAFLPFYRNHTLFQPVAFDQLFWTLGFYFLIKFINSENKNYLLYLGVTLGIGLLTKYTILVWAFGLFIGLFFYKSAALYKNKWLYISAFIALLIFLPNISWQVQHDFPLISHIQELNESQLDDVGPFDFVLVQLNFPFTLIVSVFGLVTFFIDKNLKKYRVIGIATMITFVTMWLLSSKAYYVFAIYPVLFAGGAVKIASLLKKKPVFVYLVSAVILLPIIPFIPELTPILSIEKYVSYTDKEVEDGRIELTGDYADMFGWEEQVKLVDSVYKSFTEKERKTTVLWAENYGEAGALQILGKKYGLPSPISRHGSFWSWGYQDKNATTWISLGNERESVEYAFEEVTLVKIIKHKYAIAEENDIPLYICRKPKIDIDQWWRDYEDYVFD